MTRLVSIVSVVMLIAPQAIGATSPCAIPGDEACERWTTPLAPPEGHPTTVPVDVAVDPDRGTVVAAGYARSSRDPFESTGRGWVVGLEAQQGTVRWRTTLGPPDRFLTIADAALSPDGSVTAVTGKLSDSVTARPKLYVAAIANSDGRLLWERLLPPHSVGRQVVIDATGTIVVAGFVQLGSKQDLVVTAFDAGGDQQKPAHWRGPGGHEVPEGLALTPDGRTAMVAVASRGTGSEFDSDIATLAFDLHAAPSPRPRWEARYDFTGAQDEPRGLTLSPDGTTAYVSGPSNAAADGPPFAADYDVVTLAYDTASGKRRWVYRWRPTGEGFPNPVALVAANQRVIMTLAAPEPEGQGSDIAVIGLDAASGSQAWLRIAATPLRDTERPVAAAVSPDGSLVAVTGVSGVTPERAAGGQIVDGDQITLAYETLIGEPRWRARFGADGVATGRAVTIGAGNDVYIATSRRRDTVDSNGNDVLIVAY